MRLVAVQVVVTRPLVYPVALVVVVGKCLRRVALGSPVKVILAAQAQPVAAVVAGLARLVLPRRVKVVALVVMVLAVALRERP